MNYAIVQVDINSLKPAEYNPRKWNDEQIKQLKASSERFGFVDPLIANSSQGRHNIVIAGHFRLFVAKLLKFVSVPVVYISIPDIEKEKELNIRLNKNSGEFDFDLLKGFDSNFLSGLGFSSKELDEIFRVDISEKDDEVPEINEVTKIQLGDIYKLGNHRVMCGDCTYVGYDEDAFSYYCEEYKTSLNRALLKDISIEIPSWCPLPEAEEKK